eukprot:6189955-Pleurochrysis_carterae.AAC.1
MAVRIPASRQLQGLCVLTTRARALKVKTSFSWPLTKTSDCALSIPAPVLLHGKHVANAYVALPPHAFPSPRKAAGTKHRCAQSSCASQKAWLLPARPREPWPSSEFESAAERLAAIVRFDFLVECGHYRGIDTVLAPSVALPLETFGRGAKARCLPLTALTLAVAVADVAEEAGCAGGLAAVIFTDNLVVTASLSVRGGDRSPLMTTHSERGGAHCPHVRSARSAELETAGVCAMTSHANGLSRIRLRC